ncbi:MAG: hypothetical protein Q7R47_04455, partial [Candidatus Diapherotrites archaeon]|nr:hypothetical protein [Candidatus Diapherotrites archaeon]
MKKTCSFRLSYRTLTLLNGLVVKQKSNRTAVIEKLIHDTSIQVNSPTFAPKPSIDATEPSILPMPIEPAPVFAVPETKETPRVAL